MHKSIELPLYNRPWDKITVRTRDIKMVEDITKNGKKSSLVYIRGEVSPIHTHDDRARVLMLIGEAVADKWVPAEYRVWG